MRRFEIANKMVSKTEKLAYSYGAVPMKWIKGGQSWYAESKGHQQNEYNRK